MAMNSGLLEKLLFKHFWHHYRAFCILKVDAAVNPSRFYSKQLLRRVSNQYDIENESLEERFMAVLDYISGMTDIYALDIYQKINGISLPIV